MTKEFYQIRIKGYLDPERSSWFDGLALTQTTDGETILSGQIFDQTALYGVLVKIRDLGLTLLEVKGNSSAFQVGRQTLEANTERSSNEM
jgi:hypothetical protein